MKVVTKFYKIYSLLFAAIFVVQIAFGQFTIPAKPTLQTSVYDYANLFSSSQKTFLEQKLIRYSDSTSTQIVIATIDNIGGDEISLTGAEWAHKWGIGQEKEDNGIFILLAKEERRITIQTGYGIEHLLTDAFSRRIIENIIIPEFKKGDYYSGLDKGSDAIFEVLKGTYKNNQPQKGENSGKPGFVIIFIIFIILIIVFSKKNRGGGGPGKRFRKRSTAAAILEAIILSSAGRGGFGGGSFGGGSNGGGGFGGGFGGGGFGGGGSSGGW
tara:strand:- start:1046 stop:1855 length:810 start_codon:yes stop_codon:yes gene_type:complete